MITFDEQVAKDFDNMVNPKEFAIVMVNLRTSASLNVIKTDVFVGIDEAGMPITKDTPIINLPLKYDIQQQDKLTHGDLTFIVYEVQKDGINGQDVYLKNA